MNKIQNPLLVSLSTPFPQLYKRNLTLLLNADGDLLDLATPDESGFLSSIVRQLKAKGNIRPFFGFKKSLDALVSRTSEFLGFADQFDFVEEVESFYTTLPILSLTLVRVSRDRFLGTLYPFRTLPTSFEFSSEGILYLDPDESLVGFNRAFFDIFSSRLSNPGKMLGQPLGRFITPTPDKVQSDYFERQPDIREGAFASRIEMDFTGGERGNREIASTAGELSFAPGGLTWEAPGPEGAYLTFRRKLPFEGHDIAVHLTLESADGSLPCILLGDKTQEKVGLDVRGYLLGQDAAKDRIILKRAGLTIAGRPFRFPRALTAATGFYKADRSFMVLHEGRPGFRYYDFELIERKEAFLSLYLRTGGRCLLKKMTVGLRPTPRPAGKANCIVQARTAGKGFYLWNRLNSFTLSSHGGEITGFKMQDVSEFEDRIRDLRVRYEEKVREGKRLQALLRKRENPDDHWIGKSPAMRTLREKALRAAQAPTTLLVQGATGTGKEVLANFVHGNSAFSKGPFLKVDCSTLPKELMESELFGHEKGAFTGAFEKKHGLFEKAVGGTLFLDEINNLSLESQAKLLQFLQDFKITRVGGGEAIHLDLRIIAATNADLKGLVDQGLFREDLYFRLAVITLSLPPLRERREDLPDLCRHFLGHFEKIHRKSVRGISAEGYQALYRHAWPGNIRELKNVLEQAVLFCDGGEIEPPHLSLGAPAPPDAGAATRERKLMVLSKETLALAIGEFRGHVKSLAHHYGVTPRALYYRFSQVGLDPNHFRPRPRKRAS